MNHYYYVFFVTVDGTMDKIRVKSMKSYTKDEIIKWAIKVCSKDDVIYYEHEAKMVVEVVDRELIEIN